MQVTKTANDVYVPGKLRYADDNDEMADFRLREGLNWRQRKDAEFMRSISKGVGLISGDPGSGKDLFGGSTAFMQKYYFPQRRALLDFLPRRAFGEYVPFGMREMMGEINKMAKKAGVEGCETSKDPKEEEEFGERIENETIKWATEGEGELLFTDAVWYMQELRPKAYNRNPSARTNKFIGGVLTVWRHLDLLTMGTHTDPEEIDYKAFLKKVTWRAKCSWSITRPNTSIVTIARGVFIGGSNVFAVEQTPVHYIVDGGKPRDFLGGLRLFDLYKSKNKDINLKPGLPKEG